MSYVNEVKSKVQTLLNNFQSHKPKDQIQVVNLRNELKKKAQNASYSELITYSLMLDDRIIMHKDGALSCHFTYIGPDIESETDMSIDALSAQITHALAQLEEGWMIEQNLISSKSPSYHVSDNYHDSVSEIIDIEREFFLRSEGTLFQTDAVLTLTYNTTNEQMEKLKSFALDMPDDEEYSTENRIVSKFKHVVNGLIDLLSSYNIKCMPLEKGELLSYLFNCINCSNDKIALPKTHMFLDSYLVEQDLRPGINVRVGNKNVALLSLDDMPSEHYPTILDDLSSLMVEFRWSNRFVPLPMEEAKRIFKKKYAELSNAEMGIGGLLSEMMGNYNYKKDKHATELKEMAEEAKLDHQRGMLYGYMNSTIVVYDSSRQKLRQTINEIVKRIKSKGFVKVREETINSTEAFLGSLPSHGGYNPRKIPVSIQFFADIMPTTGIYQGQPYCTSQSIGKDYPPLIETTTTGNRKFNFNLHFKDVGHTTITGPTGAGKSILLGKMIASFIKKYPGSRVIGFDYNYALIGTVRSMGGDYIDFSTGDLKLSPLRGIEDERYRKGFLLGWVLNIHDLTSGQKTTSEQKISIQRALENVAKMKPQHHNLSKFITQLDNAELQETFKAFKDSVPFNMLGGETDAHIFTNDLVFFEKKCIIDLAEHVSIPVIQYLYYRIRRTISDDPRPNLAIIDEAWYDLKHEILSEEVNSIFKAGRHDDIACVLATQVVDDIQQSPINKQIRENVRTEIFLPNEKLHADISIIESYRNIGLNEQQIKLLAYASPKRDYYIRQTLGNKLMKLQVGELALSFLGMTKKDMGKLNEMLLLIESGDPLWAFEWLKRCGHDEISEHLKTKLQSKILENHHETQVTA